MNKRDLSLSERRENSREAKPIQLPIHFSLSEIKRHFVENMDSIKAQYSVAEALVTKNNLEDSKTIWRSQVVLAEGVLDFFIHEMSKYCLFRMFIGQSEKTEKYASIKIPMSKVEEAIDATESNEWFFKYLNERFSRDVFISRESMREQLNLIGIGFTPVMVRAFPRDKEKASLEYGSKVVEDLFRRRNQIAHQNDRSHESAEQNDITKDFVSDCISKIETIVNAIYDIAEEKEQ